MINELTLTNFRGFGSLELKGLKRVNLVVGHNNTGKTSLLEGILLVSDPNCLTHLPRLFRPSQGNEHVRYFPWLIKDGAIRKDTILARKTIGDPGNSAILLRGMGHPTTPLPEGFSGPINNAHGNFFVYSTINIPSFTCKTVPVQHRDAGSLVLLIGKAYRKKNGEEIVQENLAKIDGRIKKVRIDPGEQQEGNQIIVDIGLSQLVPLSQVGQGIYRIATILADVVGEEPDILLIDEIENGLHHSVMSQVWTGLAEIAENLNVQIFATTHSGECLQAAHKAFQKRRNYDLAVIQLFRSETGVQGRVLDREHIEVAIKEDIELR